MLKYFSFLAFLFFAACSHFQGPKDLKLPGDADKPQAVTKGFSLIWPVDEVRINRGFKVSKRKRPHRGLDLGGTKGTIIRAAHSGKVIYSGRAYRGYGKMILLEYDPEWATLYGHLDRYLVKPGDVVQQGQVIGLMGRTGRATGVHLHFEVIQNKQPIDPLVLLDPSHPSFRNLASHPSEEPAHEKSK